MKGNILIVDDNPDNLRVLEAMLLADGHEVRSALSGEIALKTVSEIPPELILLDIMMPGMDGFEVCRRLKGDSATRDIPVLFISALDDMDDKLRAFQAGGVDYITKPFVEQEVLARVRNHLRLAKTQEQLLGNIRDLAREIEARKLAEEALLKSEERYRAVVEDQTEVISRFRPDGTLTFVNDAFCRFFGKSGQELIGSRWQPEAVPEDIPLIEESLHALSPSDPVVTMEIRVFSCTKEVRWMQFVNRGLFDNAGHLVEIQSVGREITEHKRAEEERKTLEAQLQQAQRMEAIGQLAGGIAHDFNNILTAIIGYSEVIAMRMDDDSPLRHYARQISTSAERAAELTNGLLAFSRKQVLHMKPLGLCSVVQGMKKMLRRLVPEDITFRTPVSDQDLIVMADRGQIEQVLMNLVTNAKDAMPMGGTLTINVSPAFITEKLVHTHGYVEPGRYACISVTDTGHGMNEVTRQRIFEPFFTTKELGKGTGLGMSIVYGIIQQHNGYISVYSEPAKGTTFRIYLSLIAAEMEKIYDVQRMVPPTGGTETILLAEDDETIRELYSMILEEAGYTVITAIDGHDALDRFIEQQATVDMLITDVVMPKMDGKRLIEEIRKVRSDTKVLFLSGYTNDMVMERGILEGEFNFMAKPIMSSDLLKKVREILDQE